MRGIFSQWSRSPSSTTERSSIDHLHPHPHPDAEELLWQGIRLKQEDADRFLTQGLNEDAKRSLESALAQLDTLDHPHPRPQKDGDGTKNDAVRSPSPSPSQTITKADHPHPYARMRSCVQASLGVALGNMGMPDEALAAFSRALEAEPSNAEAWNARAMFYLSHGDGDGFGDGHGDGVGHSYLGLARRDINECVRLQPKSVLALSNRAAIHLAAKDFKAAEEDLKAAMGMAMAEGDGDGDSLEHVVMANLSVCYAQTDRPNLALQRMGDALNICPTSAGR